LHKPLQTRPSNKLAPSNPTAFHPRVGANERFLLYSPCRGLFFSLYPDASAKTTLIQEIAMDNNKIQSFENKKVRSVWDEGSELSQELGQLENLL